MHIYKLLQFTTNDTVHEYTIYYRNCQPEYEPFPCWCVFAAIHMKTHNNSLIIPFKHYRNSWLKRSRIIELEHQPATDYSNNEHQHPLFESHSQIKQFYLQDVQW